MGAVSSKHVFANKVIQGRLVAVKACKHTLLPLACLLPKRASSNTLLFRDTQELKEFQQKSNASEGIELCPDESNIYHWEAVLKVGSVSFSLSVVFEK